MISLPQLRFSMEKCPGEALCWLLTAIGLEQFGRIFKHVSLRQSVTVAQACPSLSSTHVQDRETLLLFPLADDPGWDSKRSPH